MATQRLLAPAFFTLELLAAADRWISSKRREGDVYLFGEQQLLTAMILTLQNDRSRRARFADAPYRPIGDALLHIVNELDPLQNLTAEEAASAPTESRRLFAEFVLRNGLFYADDDHRYAITRYDEMLSHIASSLRADPEYVDLLSVFRRATGLRFRTYLAMGLALLTFFHRVAPGEPTAPALISPRRAFRQASLRRCATWFFKETATRRPAFARAVKQDVKQHGNPTHNFIEAERHPLVYVTRRLVCCVSQKFLERKFAAGVHHILLRAMTGNERKRYFPFFGRVFERYVHRVCASTFSDRFIPGFKYGSPEKEAADGWILYPRCAVVLEAKSVRFSLDLRLSGNLTTFETAFRRSILHGAQQLDRTITDFREGVYEVNGLRSSDRLLPVIVTLEYVPLDVFLSQYIDEIVREAGLLRQANVGQLTVLSIKDLEHVEGAVKGGESFADLLEARQASDVWRRWPFGNFLVDRYPDGFDVNSATLTRYKDLLQRSAESIFGVRLREPNS